jgi:hypothetical protein
MDPLDEKKKLQREYNRAYYLKKKAAYHQMYLENKASGNLPSKKKKEKDYCSICDIYTSNLYGHRNTKMHQRLEIVVKNKV